MNGDISRHTFDPALGYTAVRLQQGRVLSDADWNESVDLHTSDTRDGREDLIGQSGGPAEGAGFALALVSGRPMIGVGTYYVDGIRVVNTTQVDLFTGQSVPVTEPTAVGNWLAYLEVWERPVTPVQAPAIREVAYGGPDTATRTALAWRVLLVPANAGTVSCASTIAAWDRVRAGPTGRLAVRVAPGEPDTDPCVLPASSHYRGLENQLYRIQVHDGNFDPAEATGADGTAPTFAWSRENASVVGLLRGPIVTSTGSASVEVDRLGPGGTDGLAAGDWVELLDDVCVLADEPGTLARVSAAQGGQLTLEDPGGTVATAVSALLTRDRHPCFVRWDRQGATGKQSVSTGLVSASERSADGAWIRLENGVEVQFSSGTFRTGDAWIVPARTAILPGTTDQQLDWPLDPATGAPLSLNPKGPVRHFARIGLLNRTSSGWMITADCRSLFPAMTALTTLVGAGGDGQTARPKTWLPAPLRVRVTNGRYPVAGARVRFQILTGGGGLRAATPDNLGTQPGLTTVEAQSDANGIATVWWKLGDLQLIPAVNDAFAPAEAGQVEATLLRTDGTSTPIRTRFYSQIVDNWRLHLAGGDGQWGRPGETLELALRVRVDDGLRVLAGAQVQFTVMNQKVNGEALDEYSGGSIHASDVTTLVSSVKWPGGSRTQSAIVRTGSDGVASVQWLLGTDLRLPTQRISAALVINGVATSQAVQFTGQLGIAREIRYTPTGALKASLKGEQQNVQAAIDALAGMIGQVSPVNTGLDVLDVNGHVLSGKEIGPTDLGSFRVTGRLSKGAELRATAELPVTIVVGGHPRRVGTTPVLLDGSVERSADGTSIWKPSAQASAWLTAVSREQPIDLRVQQVRGERVVRQKVLKVGQQRGTENG